MSPILSTDSSEVPVIVFAGFAVLCLSCFAQLIWQLLFSHRLLTRRDRATYDDAAETSHANQLRIVRIEEKLECFKTVMENAAVIAWAIAQQSQDSDAEPPPATYPEPATELAPMPRVLVPSLDMFNKTAALTPDVPERDLSGLPTYTDIETELIVNGAEMIPKLMSLLPGEVAARYALRLVLNAGGSATRGDVENMANALGVYVDPDTPEAF